MLTDIVPDHRAIAQHGAFFVQLAKYTIPIKYFQPIPANSVGFRGSFLFFSILFSETILWIFWVIRMDKASLKSKLRGILQPAPGYGECDGHRCSATEQVLRVGCSVQKADTGNDSFTVSLLNSRNQLWESSLKN